MGSGTGEPESSDSMRTFGAVLQALRQHFGYSRDEFAGLVGFSVHTIVSIELGRRMPDKDFVLAADRVLGNMGVLKQATIHLRRLPGLASWFRIWAELERGAITLYTYECRMIPGLLQTEAYARTLFTEQLPPLDDGQIEAQWEARADRQQLLRDQPNTAFGFILEEHLLRRQTGGPEVTRELIDHILELSELRHVEVQIMATKQESHAGLRVVP
ncbi:helix-turn-helix transcriptional regulator [Streptomyces sp. J2-1]|nr:helix-turn-helix transcriptional regulator [Streptomyces corallincola]